MHAPIDIIPSLHVAVGRGRGSGEEDRHRIHYAMYTALSARKLIIRLRPGEDIEQCKDQSSTI